MTNHGFTVGTTPEYQWSVPLTALAAGTEYCYAVFSGDSSGATDLLPASQPDQLFTTLDSAGSTKSLTFDVVDDSAETYYALPNSSFPGNLNTDQAALDKLIGQSGARFAVLAGDTAYNNGDQTNFGDLQQGGAEVSDVFGPSYWPETGGIPTFKANGDHGLNQESLQIFPTPNTASSSGGTYAYDSYPAGFGITSSFNEPDDWYAIQSGDVRIYVLDAAWNEQLNQGNSTGSLCPGNTSNCQQYEMDYNEHWQTSSAEYQWLSHDLASHPGGSSSPSSITRSARTPPASRVTSISRTARPTRTPPPASKSCWRPTGSEPPSADMPTPTPGSIPVNPDSRSRTTWPARAAVSSSPWTADRATTPGRACTPSAGARGRRRRPGAGRTVDPHRRDPRCPPRTSTASCRSPSAATR